MSWELCISHEPSTTWHWAGSIDQTPPSAPILGVHQFRARPNDPIRTFDPSRESNLSGFSKALIIRAILPNANQKSRLQARLCVGSVRPFPEMKYSDPVSL